MKSALHSTLPSSQPIINIITAIMIDFPDEIWEYVFSNFECKVSNQHWHHDQPPDWHSFYDELRTISCVCQRFHHIAQRLIYRSISV
jgi:hypothetical protein